MKEKLAMLVLAVSLVVVSGCSSKGAVRGDGPTGGAALEKQPEATAASRGAADQAVASDDGRAAARIAAMEEAAREKAAQERAAAAKAELEQQEAAKAAEEAAAAQRASRTRVAAAEKELYELTDIRFDFDKFDLKDEARQFLKKHAEWLTKNKDVKIVVEGHCDERGTAEYNLALGERRAKAAAKFLMDLGIEGNRIKTISYGEELPMDPGHDEGAWAKNRRAHFVVAGKQ